MTFLQGHLGSYSCHLLCRCIRVLLVQVSKTSFPRLWTNRIAYGWWRRIGNYWSSKETTCQIAYWWSGWYQWIVSLLSMGWRTTFCSSCLNGIGMNWWSKRLVHCLRRKDIPMMTEDTINVQRQPLLETQSERSTSLLGLQSKMTTTMKYRTTPSHHHQWEIHMLN